MHFLYLRAAQCAGLNIYYYPQKSEIRYKELFLSLSDVILIYSSTGTELGKMENMTFRQPEAIPG